MVPTAVEYETFPVMGVVASIEKKSMWAVTLCVRCVEECREFCAVCLIYQRMYVTKYECRYVGV